MKLNYLDVETAMQYCDNEEDTAYLFQGKRVCCLFVSILLLAACVCVIENAELPAAKKVCNF